MFVVLFFLAVQFLNICMLSGVSMEPNIHDHTFCIYIENDIYIPLTNVGIIASLTNKSAFRKFSMPKRGNIILFEYGNQKIICKRVIALPGDEVIIEGKQIIINGICVAHFKTPRKKSEDKKGDIDNLLNKTPEKVLEILPTGEEYFIQEGKKSSLDCVLHLKEDEILCIGDNREENNNLYVVKTQQIKGRVLYSLSIETSKKIKSIVEIFKVIKNT